MDAATPQQQSYLQQVTNAEGLVVATTPGMLAAIDTLVNVGIYGRTRSEVAERLMSRELERLIDTGILKMVKP